MNPYWCARVESKWNHGRIILRSARRRALPEPVWTVFEDFRKMHSLVTRFDTIKILLAPMVFANSGDHMAERSKAEDIGCRTPNLV